VIAGAIPLAIGIALDLYVALARALDSWTTGALIAGAIGLILVILWFVHPLLIRAAGERLEREVF
jgi:hypothetical protein